jgi:hypothetical protein
VAHELIDSSESFLVCTPRNVTSEIPVMFRHVGSVVGVVSVSHAIYCRGRGTIVDNRAPKMPNWRE